MEATEATGRTTASALDCVTHAEAAEPLAISHYIGIRLIVYPAASLRSSLM